MALLAHHRTRMHHCRMNVGISKLSVKHSSVESPLPAPRFLSGGALLNILATYPSRGVCRISHSRSICLYRLMASQHAAPRTWRAILKKAVCFLHKHSAVWGGIAWLADSAHKHIPSPRRARGAHTERHDAGRTGVAATAAQAQCGSASTCAKLKHCAADTTSVKISRLR